MLKILDFPFFRQTSDYDCGATALLSVLVYYGIYSRLDKIMQEAGTKEVHGTTIEGIIKTAQKYQLNTKTGSMALHKVTDFIDQEIPVILPLQAWPSENSLDWNTNWDDGHYVVAIGYTKSKMIFADPSSVYRTWLRYDELRERWHDADCQGNHYHQYGIALYGKSPHFRKKRVIHMD